jgi:hypothetical protein
VTASQAGDSRYQSAEAVSRTFQVHFVFAGFFPPVANPPQVNRATAGRAVPIRFTLGGDAGLAVLGESSPKSRRVDCRTHEPRGAWEPAAALGSKPILHPKRSDRYLFPWKTQRAWAGTCRELSLDLVDGSAHAAWFRFDGTR